MREGQPETLGRPVLYSFRRCPYAMRARMAIRASGQCVELREVVLRDKPAEMLAASAKGTVPVLVLDDGAVIDESLDIMVWALERCDPAGWLAPPSGSRDDMMALIAACERDFKPHLDGYKYAPKDDPQQRLRSRERAGDFLARIEERLGGQAFLFGGRPALGDVAIFPFVRQFALVDRAWFEAAGWPRTAGWLEGFLGDDLFRCVMGKYPKWVPGQAPVLFGAARRGAAGA